jgi:hypothetical protein
MPRPLRLALLIAGLDVVLTLVLVAAELVGWYSAQLAVWWQWLHYPASLVVQHAVAPPAVVDLEPTSTPIRVASLLGAYATCWVQTFLVVWVAASAVEMLRTSGKR